MLQPEIVSRIQNTAVHCPKWSPAVGGAARMDPHGLTSWIAVVAGTKLFRLWPPDSQEAYKLLVAGLPPPPPGAPVPFRRGSSSIIALSYAMRFVHKLKNMGKAGRESSGYI